MHSISNAPVVGASVSGAPSIPAAVSGVRSRPASVSGVPSRPAAISGVPSRSASVERISVSRALAYFGDLATRTQLRGLGCGEKAIRDAIASGEASIVRRSWLAAPTADPAAVRAVALGGVLGGESALRSFGIWVSHDTGLCVAARPGSSRLPELREKEYRIFPGDFSWPAGFRWRMGVVPALAQLARRVEEPHLIASIDSALQLGLLTVWQLDDLFARLPRRLRRLRRLLDARAESGLESLLRIAAVLQGWEVDVQVRISRVGRVDLVIDGWLVVEADGDRWHSTPQQRAQDRTREAELVRQGKRSHRFGYAQIMNDIEGCVEVIRALLAAGRPVLLSA
jgi:very-short-patch-repair endonuclease